MRYQAVDPYFVGPMYNELASYTAPSASRNQRVFLVAMQDNSLRPLPDGPAALQRIHVMVVRPGEIAEFDSPLSLLTALPEIRQPGLQLTVTGGPPQLRPVRGEILWDDAGHFYEKSGAELLALHKLVAGHHGEILEFRPRGRAGRPPEAGTPKRSVVEAEIIETDNEGIAQTVKAPGSPLPPSHRNLFPDPGQLRLIAFGDFKQIIAPQLARSAQLRESHRLLCCVQVYEVTKPQSIDSLAATVLGAAEFAWQLQPLTPQAAAKMGLSALPRPRARVAPHARREPQMLLPGDRLFRIQVANDPTSLEAEQSERPTQQQATKRDVPASSQKRSIPEQYLKPWELKLGREEAIYEMNAENSRGRLASFLSWLKDRWKQRHEFQRWQTLLWGQKPEDQLWAVRPPKSALSHPTVRDWARKTLEAAGYDSSSMLVEWEIYWRRKTL